jgi:predicted phage baseplate assembly protein
MPLPMLRLDNRTFAELVAEGQTIVQRRASSWSDHNYHDPGITLMELLAWLVEADIYRLDRTPAATYRAFLRLVGVEPRTAQAAVTVVALELAGAAGARDLPAGLQIESADGRVVFETLDPITLVACRIAAVLGGADGAPSDYTAANRRPGDLFAPFGPAPAAGAALYLGLDSAPPAGAQLDLFAWTGTPDADRETRARLAAEWEATRAESAGCPPESALDLNDWRLHYSARVAWEYLAAGGVWAALPAVQDETRALTLNGPVRFTAPGDWAAGGPRPGLFFLRCRLLSGRYECPPALDIIALNTVAVRHGARVAEEQLGVSSGWAGQVFALGHPPALPGSLRLRATLGGADEQWREVQFWDRSGPHDRHTRLSDGRDVLEFGDGMVGRVPAASATIHAAYVRGGGPEGNVAAGTLVRGRSGGHNQALVADWALVGPLLQVRQPFAAAGGVEAEPLASAQARAVNGLASPQRATTLDDCARLALETPGTPLARAYAFASLHPDLPCVPAAGCVTVVVVPRCPDPQPSPGPDLLRAVARYLDRRRPLTSELHVIGPHYTTVVVDARLWPRPGADAVGLPQLAQAALGRFFHPLYGGPEGKGWPVGRAVYRAEVLALLNELPGVIAVDQLGLQADGDADLGCENLLLCPDGLVASGSHRIRTAERSAA